MRQTRCTLHSRRLLARGARHRAPLNITFLTHPKTEKITAEPYRKLFEQYLSYVLPHEKRHHPLWAQLNAIYEASASTFIDAQALTLAVAIESILGSEFPNLGQPSKQEIKHIEEALAYWKQWKGDPKVKARITGSLSQFKKPRAGDKMRALAEHGAISAEAAKAWTRLRNANAHAYQQQTLTPDQFRDLLGVTQTLFYQLIFHAIGYRGPYCDYGSLGWPMRHYPPSKPERATGKEIHTIDGN